MDVLLEKALAVNQANLALGNEVFAAASSTFVRNRAHPIIYDANHVADIRASGPAEIEAILACAEAEYAHCHHRRFDVDFRTPPAFIARLALEDYERRDELLMLLEDELLTAPRAHDIRPIETEADWHAFAALKMADWYEYSARRKMGGEPEVGESLIVLSRAKQPPVQYWMAVVGGRGVAYMNSWEGAGGVGQIEDVFTHQDYRHQGLAAALMHHAVAAARRKGAQAIAIVADPTDTPKQMYAAMGFRPAAVVSHYLKRLPRGG